MERALFIVFLLALAGGVAVGGFSILLQVRMLLKRDESLRVKRFRRGLITLVLGEMVRATILIEAIIINATVESSVEAYIFLVGLVVGGIGMVLLLNTTIEETAEIETADSRVESEVSHQLSEHERVDAEVGRQASEEYRERGEDYRETGEARREQKENE